MSEMYERDEDARDILEKFKMQRKQLMETWDEMQFFLATTRRTVDPELRMILHLYLQTVLFREIKEAEVAP
jgi:hypothetical protein